MNVRDALLQRVNQRMMRMRQALERFDDVSAERERVGPKWNVRDLAGHLTHWTNEAAEQLGSLARGVAGKKYDFERINDEVYRRNRRMSYVMLLPQLRRAEDRFVEALGAVDPRLLIGETAVRKWVDEAILEHYDHHWTGLKAAVERLSSG